MTPIDKLKNGLDELGVEYDAASYDNAVFWGNAEYEMRGDGNTRLIVDDATPKQAINATVGAGTCHMKLLENIHTSAYQDTYECDECGEQVLRETYMGKSEPPKFCPNCGAYVIKEA